MSHVMRKLFGIAVLVFALIGIRPIAAQSVTPQKFLKLCAKGTAEEVRQALDSGANIAAQDVRGWTALMFAAKDNADPHVMKMLLDAAAEFNEKGLGENNEKGFWGKGQELLKKGKNKLGFKAVDVNAKAKEDGKTALMFALENKSPYVVQLLLDAGADANIKDKQGKTALMWAAAKNSDPVMVKVLLKGGADTDIKDKQDMTALMWAAAKNSNPEVVKELVDGAEVNFKGKQDMTALMWAAAENSNPEMVTAFLNGGADINAKDKNGKTALMYAAEKNSSPEMVRKLLGAGADINAKDEKNRTALMYAVWKNSNPKVVEVLLSDPKADVKAMDKSDNDVIWYAKERKRKDGVKDILGVKDTSVLKELDPVEIIKIIKKLLL